MTRDGFSQRSKKIILGRQLITNQYQNQGGIKYDARKRNTKISQVNRK